MKPLATASALITLLALGTFGLTGCATNASTAGAEKTAATASAHQMTCPITGEPVIEDSPSAMYGIEPVYCASVADARQFASLPKEKRAKLFAAQRAQAEGR